jgi:hypothetical protein
MDQAAKVEQEKQYKQIEQYQNTAGANLVADFGERQRKSVEPSAKVEEHHQERADTEGYDEHPPHLVNRQQYPNMPTNVYACHYGQQHEYDHPHISRKL